MSQNKNENEMKLFEIMFEKGRCYEKMKNFLKAIIVYNECTTLNVQSSKVFLRIA